MICRRNWPSGAVVEPVKVNCESEHNADEDRREPRSKDTGNIEHRSNLHDYRISPCVSRPASRMLYYSKDKAEKADMGVHPGNGQRKLGFRVRTRSLDFADAGR